MLMNHSEKATGAMRNGKRKNRSARRPATTVQTSIGNQPPEIQA